MKSAQTSKILFSSKSYILALINISTTSRPKHQALPTTAHHTVPGR